MISIILILIIVVIILIKNVVLMLVIERIVVFVVGERNIIKDVILLFILFIFIRYFFGMICGINVFIVGVCIFVLVEWMSNIIKSN